MNTKRKKNEKKVYTGRMNFFLKTAIAVFLAVMAITIVSMQFEYNALVETEKSLRTQIATIEGRIEELNVWLERPYDDEYIKQVAREKLNLHLPGEIIFYNDLIK